MDNKQSYYTKITGVNFNNKDGTKRQELLKLSKPGDQLFLIPSPNEYDDTAVKVMSNSLNEHLGWLKSEISEDMFNWIKEGNEYKAQITEINGQDDGNKPLSCNIQIEKSKASGDAINRQNMPSKDNANKTKTKDNKEETPNEKTTQEKTEELSNKMQDIGCLLTIVLTIPIVLTILLGPFGLGISIVLIVLYFIGKNKGE